MQEKDIEKHLVKYAEQKGMLTFKFTSPATAGVCDRIFIHKGRVLFMEIKTLKGRLSPLQQRHGERLQAHGANYAVVYGLVDGRKVLTDFYADVFFNGDFS